MSTLNDRRSPAEVCRERGWWTERTHPATAEATP